MARHVVTARALIEPRKPRRVGGLRVDVTPGLTSIVVATLGHLPVTKSCIASIRQHAGCAVEIIVVDNGSTDGTLTWLRSQHDIVTLRNAENGVASAWNLGLAEARGDVCVVLNNDVTVLRDGIKRLAEAARETGVAGQTGGMFSFGSQTGIATADARQAKYVEGYCLAIRRDALETIRLFDEQYQVAYCEDAEFGCRVREAGYKFRLVAGCVKHVGQVTSRGMKLDNYYAANTARLFHRYGPLGLGKHILVRRTGAAGDVVMALGAVELLRWRYPHAHIAFQTHPRLAELPLACESVNAVNPPDTAYDVIYDLDGAYETAPEQHALAAFIRGVGIPLPVAAMQSEPAAWNLRALADGRRIVCCGLRSAFRSAANWRTGEWQRLVAAMPDTLFVLLDPEKQPLKDAAKRFWTRANVLDVTGQTPRLTQALDLIAQSDIVLTVDTAPLHLAAVAGKPLVCLWSDVLPQYRTPLHIPSRYLTTDATAGEVKAAIEKLSDGH